jgi:hypothetical protein
MHFRRSRQLNLATHDSCATSLDIFFSTMLSERTIYTCLYWIAIGLGVLLIA